MPDIATIATFLGSIRTATELAKAIKGADLSLEKAETKLKIAELISALADAKIQAAEIQDLLQEKDKEIKDLKNLISLRDKVVRGKYGFYYKEDDQENNEPLCPKCWESEEKTFHLGRLNTPYFPQYYSFTCPNCDKPYQIEKSK